MDIVVGDNFKFFLPHPNVQLSQCYLHVAFCGSNSRKGDRGSIKSFVPRVSQPVYSEFIFSSELRNKASRTDDSTSVHRTFADFELCKVSAREPLSNLSSLLASNDTGSKDAILTAVTKSFKRSSVTMVCGHWKRKFGGSKGPREMGNKVFDFLELADEEAVHVGSGFEVRRSITAFNEIIGDSICQVVTPIHAVIFEKGVNLAELVVQIVGTANLDESTYNFLKELLKRMAIIKTYGKNGARRIVDLGRRPSNLTIACGEVGRRSVEQYTGRGQAISLHTIFVTDQVTEHGQNIHIDYANLPCIKVGNSKIDVNLGERFGCVIGTAS